MSGTKHVYAAVCAVMAELAKEGISKDGKNVKQGYSFRGIDAVYNHLAPILAKHNLCILPRVVERETVDRKTTSGSLMVANTLLVEYDFVSAVDGSMHTIRMVGEAADSGDKSANKAMSAAYKYAAIQAFCIPTEGDNDADSHTHEFQHQKTATAQPQKRTGAPIANSDQIARLEDWLLVDGLESKQIAGIKDLLERHKQGKLTASRAQEALDKLSTLNRSK